jgi:hypothetical protein
MLSKKIALFFLLFLVVAGLLVSSPVLAQSTATLQGTVSDAKGALIPNATVTVRNRSTSFERVTQTDSDGNYQVAALPVGVYTIEVRVEGFKTQVADHVTVEVAKTVVQNFQLDVGAISEQVQVSSDVPVIETATTSVGTVINQRTVQEIPLERASLRRPGIVDSRFGDATTKRFSDRAAAWPGIVCIQHRR